MASTVTGRVRRDATPVEILAATFPGASITGAPKHHTMEIIAELETESRGVYTGTVGLFLPGSDFTCNLAIRTLVHQRGGFRLGVGAGMVWESDPLEEYEETLTKATFALPPTGSRWEPAPPDERVQAHSIGLFETLLLEAACANADASGDRHHADLPARYRNLAEHLDRMERSARQLKLSFDRDAVQARLDDLARSTRESVVVRFSLDLDGRLHAIVRPLPKTQQEPVSLLISPFRTDPLDPLLTHKTTARHLYDREFERARACGCADALFFNYLGRVTEGAITNIFVRHGGIWVTPPVMDGLLPGIWRAGFLGTTGASEQSLTLDDLLGADEIVIGNSVRGAMQVGTLVVNWLEGLV
jgi:para-aminobenzoate synthetase/4-amino-4-deoxychorismate lyase